MISNMAYDIFFIIKCMFEDVSYWWSSLTLCGGANILRNWNVYSLITVKLNVSIICYYTPFYLDYENEYNRQATDSIYGNIDVSCPSDDSETSWSSELTQLVFLWRYSNNKSIDDSGHQCRSRHQGFLQFNGRIIDSTTSVIMETHSLWLK